MVTIRGHYLNQLAPYPPMEMPAWVEEGLGVLGLADRMERDIKKRKGAAPSEHARIFGGR